MTRAEIEAEVLAWIAEGVRAPADSVHAPAEADDARFERLALALFAYQYEHGDAFRRVCDAFSRPPERVGHWREIPAVPTGAFKEARLICFPDSQTQRVFRSSGTTAETRGELALDTLELYEASLLATFNAHICPDVEKIRFMVLAPSSEDAPDSSLSYMFSHAVHQLGAAGSRFYVSPGEISAERSWEPGALIADLQTLAEPVALVGTAFAFVHLIDALEKRGLKLALPEGSRVMETGGFKGRSRELSRKDLHGAIAHRFGLPLARIVNQYGMCELGSQFYEDSLRTGVYSATKIVPPWVRTRVVDPATLEDVAPGRTGILQHFDLANTGSVLAVQTSDEGALVVGVDALGAHGLDAGFEVYGRLRGAEARGCSIAADALLGRE